MTTIKNYRWLIVVLLFTATTINYLDRQIIGLLKPILEKEFDWTETDFARIVMAFTAAYAPAAWSNFQYMTSSSM